MSTRTWATSRVRLARRWVAAAGIAAALAAAVNALVGTGFHHAPHVESYSTACVSCHPRAGESQATTDDLRPRLAQCSGCHGPEAAGHAAAYGFVVGESDEPLGAARPPEGVWAQVRFSHRAHAGGGAIQCPVCHGAEHGAEPARPGGSLCLRCHDGVRLSDACEVCHAGPIDATPADHAGDWRREHARAWRATRGAECAHCHRPPDCQVCHEATGILSTEPGDVDPPAIDAGSGLGPSGSRETGLALARVHGLDFRFTHPFEAEGKEVRCGVCHEIGRDCAECHDETAAGGEALHRPGWHDGADWGIVGGPGSGGGRHGDLARRDMERCAACHDVEGADPTCLRCHIDLDGQRGTDPSPHPDGFKHAFGSDSFHGDEGAVCYFCHRRSPDEDGFCTYCHSDKDD